MVTLAPPSPLPEAARAAPAGRVRIVGTADAELVVALIVNDLAMTAADEDDADVVLVLDGLGDDQLGELTATGRAVVATAPLGDLDRAMALARLGVADILTTPITGDVAARKLRRVVRDRARRPR
jgi:hypothetical protein